MYQITQCIKEQKQNQKIQRTQNFFFSAKLRKYTNDLLAFNRRHMFEALQFFKILCKS